MPDSQDQLDAQESISVDAVPKEGKSNQEILQEDTRDVPFDAIRIEESTNPRTGLNRQVVNEYAEQMKAGEVFPPVVLFTMDGRVHWIGDGFHRVHAAMQLGTTVRARVCRGGPRDALLHALGANRSHGLRLTNKDKRNVVTIALTDPEWGKWSDRKIAKKCGVSNMTVGRIREELIRNGTITVTSCSESDERRYVDRFGNTTTMKVEKAKHDAEGEESTADVDVVAGLTDEDLGDLAGKVDGSDANGASDPVLDDRSLEKYVRQPYAAVLKAGIIIKKEYNQNAQTHAAECFRHLLNDAKHVNEFIRVMDVELLDEFLKEEPWVVYEPWKQ